MCVCVEQISVAGTGGAGRPLGRAAQFAVDQLVHEQERIPAEARFAVPVADERQERARLAGNFFFAVRVVLLEMQLAYSKKGARGGGAQASPAVVRVHLAGGRVPVQRQAADGHDEAPAQGDEAAARVAPPAVPGEMTIVEDEHEYRVSIERFVCCRAS